MKTLIAVLCLVASVQLHAETSVDHGQFDLILKDVVVDGRVDYLRVRQRHWEDLTDYLNRMGDVDHENLSRDERLALYCNLYNATMIRTIVERFHAAYSPAENNKQIFRDSLVRVKGRTITLNELEHKLIRAGFNEPRIHAALVCGGLGCPRQAAHAYKAADLDATLDADMNAWINDPEKNVVDAQSNAVTLAKLFKFYADDFGGIDSVVRYVDARHPTDFTAMSVTFSEVYDWTLNLATPRDGTWVRIVPESAALRGDAAEAAKSIGTAFRNQTFEQIDQNNGFVKVIRPFGEGEAWLPAGAVQPFAYVGKP